MALGSQSLGGLHPTVRLHAEYALAYARHFGIPVRVTSGRRSTEQQRVLYQQYRACVDRGTFGTDKCATRWPANPPGTSSHEYGLAWDSVVENPQHQAAWNYIRAALGFEVPRNDVIHAQVPDWRRYI